MRVIATALLLTVTCLPIVAAAGSGYKIADQSGIMFFVAVDAAQKDNEDVYRLAVGEACAGKSICQVHFWVGSAPSKLPLTDAQVGSKPVHWQLNLNTGLRRWLVKCKSSNFARQRKRVHVAMRNEHTHNYAFNTDLRVAERPSAG